MTTINGKNKLERQITKAKKYLGIDLKNGTNKFLVIENVDDKEKTFYADSKSVRLVNTKYGEKFIVEADNIENKIWVSSWAVIEADFYSNDGSRGYGIIFKAFKDADVLALKKAAKGADDIWNVYDNMKHFDVRKSGSRGNVKDRVVIEAARQKTL